ncbi:MAG TPA: acyl carrier protein [Steroidobacteraceae bacterium]|jgi:acyl carrier protein|nr:acyl carrier protein [Steroidobacteraceae bacterium]
MSSTSDRVRSVLKQHAKLTVDAAGLADNDDLYAVGLSSFSTVQLMLALEEEFNIEIPDKMLNRRSFESVAAITGVVEAVANG